MKRTTKAKPGCVALSGVPRAVEARAALFSVPAGTLPFCRSTDAQSRARHARNRRLRPDLDAELCDVGRNAISTNHQPKICTR